MNKNITIITGHTDGIGKELSNIIVNKKNYLIGVSKRKNKLNKNKYLSQIKHDFKKDNLSKSNLNEIFKLLKNKKCTFILNAGVNLKDTNKKKINMKKFILIYKINFHNQISFLLKLLEKNLIKSVVMISSYNVFFESKFNKAYSVSKKMIYDFNNNFKNNLSNINFKTVILSSVDTKMFNKNKFFTHKNNKKKKPHNPKIVADKILKFSNSKKDIFFLKKIKT